MKYVVRKIGWEYDDNFYHEDGARAVLGLYSSKEEAEKAKLRLDWECYRAAFPLLTLLRKESSWHYAPDETILKMFLRDVCSFDGVVLKSVDSIFFDSEDWVFSMTLEDVENFQRLIGTGYHMVDSIPEDIDEVYIIKDREEDGVFLSLREAIIFDLKDRGEQWYESFKITRGIITIEGSYRDLSSTPKILEDLVRSCDGMRYKAGVLEVFPECSDESLLALNGLLKTPLVKVRRIPPRVEAESGDTAHASTPDLGEERHLIVCRSNDELEAYETESLTYLAPRPKTVFNEAGEQIVKFLTQSLAGVKVYWSSDHQAMKCGDTKYTVYCRPVSVTFLADGLRASYAFYAKVEQGQTKREIPWDISNTLQVTAPTLPEAILLATGEWLRRDGERFLGLFKEG